MRPESAPFRSEPASSSPRPGERSGNCSFRSGSESAARLGSGETWWSWISLEDDIRAIRHLIDRPVSGPVNLTAPNPVTNAELTKALGGVLRRPTLIPVPRFALELLLGKELAAALLFASARVLPVKLQESGFEFRSRATSGSVCAIGRDDGYLRMRITLAALPLRSLRRGSSVGRATHS